MKHKALHLSLFAFFWMAYTLPALAEPVTPPDEEDPVYQDPAPIDDWFPLLVFAGIILGMIYLVKRESKTF